MSEHGHPFGLLVGLVGSKLKGGEGCKQAACAAELWTSRKPLMLLYHGTPCRSLSCAGHRGSGHRVLAQAALALAAGQSRGWFGQNLRKGAWQGSLELF